jgi:hypothetical protein
VSSANKLETIKNSFISIFLPFTTIWIWNDEKKSEKKNNFLNRAVCDQMWLILLYAF